MALMGFRFSFVKQVICEFVAQNWNNVKIILLNTSVIICILSICFSAYVSSKSRITRFFTLRIELSVKFSSFLYIVLNFIVCNAVVAQLVKPHFFKSGVRSSKPCVYLFYFVLFFFAFSCFFCFYQL